MIDPVLAIIYWALESIYIIMCIWLIYGKQFRFNRKNIALILFYLFMLGMEKYIPFVHLYLYIGYILYVIVEFGYEKQKTVINLVLSFVLITLLQLLVYILWSYAHDLLLHYWIDEYSMVKELLLNVVVLLIVWFLLPKLKLERFSRFLRQKILFLRIVLLVAFVFMASLVLEFHFNDLLYPEQYFVIIVSLLLIGGVTYMWQNSHHKAMEREMQLQMHQLYDEGFENLITEIRKRQHDFQNHLNAIHSMHYTCDTLEELVEKQETYVGAIQQDNKYNKLLKIGNSVIIGFLYGKFVQAERQGITVSYHIQIGDLQSKMPIHKMVEMIGNLFDNAVEAIKEGEKEKVIYLEFTETQDRIQFNIKNESDYVSQEQQIKMFEKGESSKGEHRGFGLANVKQICEEYKCDLQVKNRKKEEKVYLEFQITIKGKK